MIHFQPWNAWFYSLKPSSLLCPRRCVADCSESEYGEAVRHPVVMRPFIETHGGNCFFSHWSKSDWGCLCGFRDGWLGKTQWLLNWRNCSRVTPAEGQRHNRAQRQKEKTLAESLGLKWLKSLACFGFCWQGVTINQTFGEVIPRCLFCLGKGREELEVWTIVVAEALASKSTLWEPARNKIRTWNLNILNEPCENKNKKNNRRRIEWGEEKEQAKAN